MDMYRGRGRSRSTIQRTPSRGGVPAEPIVLIEDPVPMVMSTPARPHMMAMASSADDADQEDYSAYYSTSNNDRLLSDSIVVVSVGPEQEKTSVHTHLLTAMSPYFHRLISQAEDEGQAGSDIEIQVQETDPKLFKMFVRWLYGTAFGNGVGQRGFHFGPPDEEATIRDFIGLYILGNTLEVSGLRNAALDTIYNYYAEETEEARCPNMEDVQHLFDHTEPTSNLRRLLVVFVLFFLFSKRRIGLSLPGDWQRVLEGGGSGELAWAMIRMMGDWRWQMGHNCPPMRLKSRQTFHDLDMGVKVEQEDDGVGYSSQTISRAGSHPGH